MRSNKRTLLAAALTVAAANAAPSTSTPGQPLAPRSLSTSPKATSNGCTYVVPGIGAFTEAIDIDFTTVKQVPSTLTISSDTIAAGTAPFARQFVPKNVAVSSSGYLALTVPGNQISNPIKSGEVQTAAKDALYGSIRTVAMASNVPGTTHGMLICTVD